MEVVILPRPHDSHPRQSDAVTSERQEADAPCNIDTPRSVSRRLPNLLLG